MKLKDCLMMTSMMGAAIVIAACTPTATKVPVATITVTPTQVAPTPAPTLAATIEPQPIPSVKDATYLVESRPITMVNGLSAVEAAPGSASKITTRYFGNDARGDLNADGREDVALLLTQEGNGSGTFFYVVVALRTTTGDQGTNAILLGDRIAPQSTSIEKGVIVVNYADRKQGEPMTKQPSVGVSRKFIIADSNLVEVKAISKLTNRVWKWVNTQMNDGTVITPTKNDAFTLVFTEDGSISGTTDCNSYFGSYTVVESKLAFDKVGSTMMACEGSQEGNYLKPLVDIESYLLGNGGNTLVLQIKKDSGTMLFN